MLEIQQRFGLTFNFSGGAKGEMICRQPPPVDEEEEEMLKRAIAMSMEEKEEKLFSIRHQRVGEL